MWKCHRRMPLYPQGEKNNMGSVDSMKKSLSPILISMQHREYSAKCEQMRVSNWNVIDSVIYFIENILSKLIDKVRESKDKLPEPEEMIEAATRELQEEKEELLQYRIPGQMIKLDGHYACPKCKTMLPDSLDYKYCPECGKRVVVPNAYPYKKSENGSNLISNIMTEVKSI